MATVRVFHEKGRRKAHEVLHTAHEELKRKTGQFSKDDLVERPGPSDG
jgi:hypothetical protein